MNKKKKVIEEKESEGEKEVDEELVHGVREERDMSQFNETELKDYRCARDIVEYKDGNASKSSSDSF